MKRIFILIALVALFFRFSLILSAYHGDLNNNISWGELLLERGPAGFYGSSDADEWPFSAPNQPPLYLFVFAGTVWFDRQIESAAWWLNDTIEVFPSKFIWFWQESGQTITAKLPGIFADISIAFLIFLFFVKKKREKTGLLLAAVWLFNPVAWYSSTIWGQTDSLVNLLGLAAVLALISGGLVLAAFLFTLSLMYKGSLSIFAPFLIIYALKQKFEIKTYLKGLSVAVFTIFAISFWFHPYWDYPLWIVDLYQNRILPGEIGFLTANAFNFWWLVDPGQTLDSQTYFNISARTWGILVTMSGMIVLAYALIKRTSEKKLLICLALFSFISFLFLTRMHERYLYPLFPYATMLLGYFPSTGIIYAAVSVVHLLNLYHLFWQPEIPNLIHAYSHEWFPKLLSISGIFLLFSFIYFINTKTKSN
jgi:dolichyl-phosphate-mannose-protein mannosyltransferase